MQGALTIVLLSISNIFMTIAWYGHLRFRSAPLWEVIIISWLIAFLEYCFQVPANRIGSYEFSAAQLKVIQEVITLVVFSVFSVLYLKQQFQWNYLIAFALIVGAVFFVFVGGNSPSTPEAHKTGQNCQSQVKRAVPKEVESVEEISDPSVSIASSEGTVLAQTLPLRSLPPALPTPYSAVTRATISLEPRWGRVDGM